MSVEIQVLENQLDDSKYTVNFKKKKYQSLVLYLRNEN
jgi:hypothetical protein